MHDIILIATLLLIFVIALTIYSTVCYKYFNGTFGKLLLGLKLTDNDGYKVSTKNMLKREWYKWMLLYGSLFIYGIISLYSLFFNFPIIHDKIAKTKVR